MTCTAPRRTTCRTRGKAFEDYRGTVRVDGRTFAQRATADCTYRLSWPGVDVRLTSSMTVEVGVDGYHVTIHAEAFEGPEGGESSVGSRSLDRARSPVVRDPSPDQT